jgi:DNA modification methylase
LLEHIIKTSTRPGDTVLDFCMGNGTTLKAAQNLGRKAAGIDITEMYCKRATERLRQMNLFSPSLVEQMDKPKPQAAQLPLLGQTGE